jgi:hypothetical protein
MNGDTFFEQDDKIDDRYWEELQSLNPSDVCRRSLARYDHTKGAYQLRLLDEDLLIYPSQKKVVRAVKPLNQHDMSPGFNVVLVSVHYLLHSKEIPMTCEYVTGQELTDGDFFFKGPHALPDWKIQKRFENDAEAFLEKGKLLGGVPIDFGDVGLEFLLLPRIRIACVLWLADDEFPARAQFLFDATADKHFALDVLWAMCNLLTNKLLAD